MRKNKLRVVIGLFSFMLIALVGCQDDTLLGLPAQDSVAPGVPVLDRVVNKNGGATIYFTAPSDRDLLGVKAVYTINGKEYTKSASLYVDSIDVAGFGSDEEYVVVLTSVDNSMNLSASIDVTIAPLETPLELVYSSLQLIEAFGGVKVQWINPTQEPIIVTVNGKDEFGDWIELDEFYSSTVDGIGTVRNLVSEAQDFQFYIRDGYGNYSVIDSVQRTPIYEELLDHELFDEINPLPGDAKWGAWGGSYVQRYIWTPTGNPDNCFHTHQGEIGTYTTFDIGQLVKLSRYTMWQRRNGADGWLFDHNNLKRYDIYGAAELTNDMRSSGSLEGWTLIYEATVIKPSGQDTPTNQRTNEDIAFALKGHEHEIPLEAPAVRYLRLHMIESWSGGNQAMISETRFWGSPQE